MKKIRQLGLIVVMMFSLALTACSESSVKNDEATMESKQTTSAAMNYDMESAVVTDENMMLNEGVMAPDFELSDIDGNTYMLSELKGNKVVLKFWASWCPICLAGLEELDTLMGMENDFEIYTIVSPGTNGEMTTEEFITWFKSLDYKNITVLLDGTGEIVKAYSVRAYPTVTFIGSDGVLIESLPGHKSNEEILEKISTFK